MFAASFYEHKIGLFSKTIIAYKLKLPATSCQRKFRPFCYTVSLLKLSSLSSLLRHAAPWLGVTRLTYDTSKFEADLCAVYNSEISNAELAPEEQEKGYMYATDENGNPYSPAWATLNFKALYKITYYLIVTVLASNI